MDSNPDKDQYKKIFKILEKYSPESRKEEKDRLQKEAKEKMEDEKKRWKKYLKSGLNHVTYLIVQKRAKLVLIAVDVDLIETVVFLPSPCKIWKFLIPSWLRRKDWDI